MDHFPLASRRRRLPDEGDLEVFVSDEQDDQPVEVFRWRVLAENVVRAQGVRGEAELALRFVDETAMADLNERFMEVEGPTDVLAFPLDDEPATPGRWPDNGTTRPDPARAEPEEPPLLLGDVVICPAVAARNAPEHAGTYDDEIALLVVHGILHILGMDHADPDEEAAMQARERELLDRFHRTGLP